MEKIKKEKEVKWTYEDFTMLFNALKKIIYNQHQIEIGIIALAKKEGLEISFVDNDSKITLEGDSEK